jgi:hypothetical protein
MNLGQAYDLDCTSPTASIRIPQCFSFASVWILWLMKRCIWCLGEFVHAPLEHTIQESLDGYAVTDKVCETCNKRIGHRLEERAQGFPLIVTTRRRLGLINVNPPPTPEETIFKRLIAKIALEFLAERVTTTSRSIQCSTGGECSCSTGNTRTTSCLG